MTRQTGGQILVQSLLNLGANLGFGVPGESYLAVLDALYDVKDRFEFVICRNEGGAAFMAEAAAKMTGKPGLCFVTRGPGAANATIGIHTALQASTPMLVFVGQVATDQKGREAFQEVDYVATYGEMAKWAVEIDDVDRVPEILGRAWVKAISGRPGPVVIALPEDMLTATTDAAPISGPLTVAEPALSNTALSQIKSALKNAQRPLILAGGGGWSEQGKSDLDRFARQAQIPVVVAARFHDLMDHNSPAYAGDASVGMHPETAELIRNADTILAIGPRFGEMTTGAYTHLSVPFAAQNILHIHQSSDELGKLYLSDTLIHAGPNEAASSLTKADIQGDWTAWYDAARANYETSLEIPDQPDGVDMAHVMGLIQSTADQDCVVTSGAGNFAIWPNRYWKVGAKQKFLAPQSGAMGYGLPAAMGAKAVDRNRQVICFAGDGDFQMNCNELGTALQFGFKPIILILNNGTYGTIRMHQEMHYPKRVSGTDLINPDFETLAQSYGFKGYTVTKTEQFDDVWQEALSADHGVVIDLHIGAEPLTPKKRLSQF